MTNQQRDELDEFLRRHTWDCNTTKQQSVHVPCDCGRDAARARLALLREQKDGAYKERDALVCALSKVFRSWLSRHPSTDTTWDDDWRWIVFVQLPTGQATWHIHDSELPMFEHLQVVKGNVWDGHTTEEKYRRLAATTRQPKEETER